MALRARIPRSVVTVPPRKREGMSGAHLAMVRKLPCIVCGRPAEEAHHLLRGLPPDERGTSRRAADRWAVPVCIRDHRAAHAHGDDERWLAERGVDGRAIAAALWSARGDEQAMMRVVERSLLGRRISGDRG